ncbi:unnamed protein product [Diatraea saccharalis]|uniref:Uncharacterized protein n=1 Tax=Diatraea saccharalis TaxID=40085 RepID=A0A9N9N4A3_9NEOP|nr:unnamed protein product [Diatraea saccharalis]
MTAPSNGKRGKEAAEIVALPSIENVQEGLVVLVDGYEIGITVIAMVAGISSGGTYPQLNPLSGYFYTNLYRWGLRYFSLVPLWMGGHAGNFVETHRVWKRRFYYMDELVPKWLQTLFFYVKKEDWAREEWEFKRFKKYAEPAFGKHFRYPSKVFNNFKSQETSESVENMDSDNSID